MSTHSDSYPVEAAESLLGAVLYAGQSAHARVAPLVALEDLRADHRAIYAAITDLAARGEAIDGTTVSEHLARRGQLEAVGGRPYLARLIEAVPSATNVESYARSVSKAARLSKAGELGAALARDASGAEDVDELLAEHVRAVSEISSRPAGSPPLREMAKPDLATATLAVIRFVVALLLPRGFVSLLSGHGDAGKTLLALVIAAHVACGRRFADLACVTGRVLFVSLEDRADLIWLRLRRIAEAFGLDFAMLSANITVLDAPDSDDAALAFESNWTGMRGLVFTPAFDQIRARASGHDLIVVDNVSDAYDANENERRMVRRFVRALQRIARENDAAVWLLAHLDKAGVRYGTNGESYSGSTAWHNSVRSRMALLDGDAGLELVHEKCNLAKKLEHPIVLERTEHGVPMPVSRAQREQHERADATSVLAAVRGALISDLVVPTAVSGPRTTLHVLAGRPELPAELAADSKRIRAALTALEREGAIWRESYVDDHRHKKERYQCGS